MNDDGKSFRQILRSTSIIGGATVINMTPTSQTLTGNTSNAHHDTNGTCGCTGVTTTGDVFFRFTLGPLGREEPAAR